MANMSSEDFMKKIKADPCGAYLFFGDEDYLKVHALRTLKEAMGIDPSLEIFNYVRLDVLDYTPERLIDSLSMLPMMAEKKLVALSGINIGTMRSGEIDELCGALAHLEEFDYNVFVLMLPAGSIDDGFRSSKETSPLSMLSKLLTPVKFDLSTPPRLASWAMKHFAHNKIAASSEDCAFLVDYCGKSMFLLSNEIEKLCHYAASRKSSSISRNDILEVCCAEVEYGAFEFANALLANRRADALSVLSAMKFKQIEPVTILSELSRVYCDLLTVKLMLLAGKSSFDISKEMNMKEFKAQLYVRSAQNMELERLRKLLDACCEADREIKLNYAKNYIPLEKFICSI